MATTVAHAACCTSAGTWSDWPTRAACPYTSRPTTIGVTTAARRTSRSSRPSKTVRIAAAPVVTRSGTTTSDGSASATFCDHRNSTG